MTLVAAQAMATADRLGVEAVARKLLSYCRERDWAGYDPYDALNSRWLETLPVLNRKLPRLVLTQALKRSPVNVRPLLRIPPTQNPKGLALFLAALLKAPRLTSDIEADLPRYLIDRLVALRSPDAPYWCWGYSFAWQTRTQVVPRGTPNLVCTTFVAESLLDAYEQRGDTRCLAMAVSATEYIHKELYRTDGDFAGFSYPLPSMPARIFNANLLAAALFCRVARLTGHTTLLDPAMKAARYAASRQREDGSWPYGEGNAQQWVDNFHTGYNLGALRAIDRQLGSTEFVWHVRRGFDFYRAHFIAEGDTPRYFHNRTYPIDIHAVAQTVITLIEFRDLDPTAVDTAEAVLAWATDHMWDERGFFYYRVLRSATIRTSYMRWSQAWMLRALSNALASSDWHQPSGLQQSNPTPYSRT
jgi:hypothetical protein